MPSSALVAELTDDYDERTSLLSFRYFFGWISGTLLAAFSFLFYIVDTDNLKAIENVAGYGKYGLLAASLIFLAILASALGTHNQIPKLRQPPARRAMTLRLVFKELFETLASRSLAALFGAAVFGAVATGVGAGLNIYLNTYFWGFASQEISIITLALIPSALLSLFISPIVSRTLGKKKGALIVGAVAFTIAPLPYALRLLGLMPENGDPALFYIVFSILIFDVALIIAFQTLMSAMIADVVEESELKTQRRSEGVFFAAITFSRKIVQGLGVFSAAIILSLAGFPDGARDADVVIPQDAINRLGLYYMVAVFTMWMAMIAVLATYRIDRKTHEQNLAALGRTQP